MPQVCDRFTIVTWDLVRKHNRPCLFQIHFQFYLRLASIKGKFASVAKKPKPKHRSGCPVSISLEILGDRWSLLIIRDLMVRAYRTYGEFLEAGEGIATNILADRLKKLEAANIITAETTHADGRKIHYRLTEKGIDLAPVLLDLLLWGARHEKTGAPCEVMARMASNREEVLAETLRRWHDRDPNPLLPKFGSLNIPRRRKTLSTSKGVNDE